MAYSDTLNFVQGDRLPQIEVTLRDKNTAAAGKTLDEADETTWSIVDLTGGTVRMKIREVGATTIKDTLTGVVTDAAGGKAVFLLNATTLDTAGQFESEVEFTNSSDLTQTVYDLIKIKIREQF